MLKYRRCPFWVCAVTRRRFPVGERAGQPLSRDRKLIPGADAVCVAEGNMSKSANASTGATRRGRRTWHARKLFVREPGDLRIGHRPLGVDGPRREGEEP